MGSRTKPVHGTTTTLPDHRRTSASTPRTLHNYSWKHLQEHGKERECVAPTQRRYYTPRSITQQAEDVLMPAPPPRENKNIKIHSPDAQNDTGSSDFYSPVSRDYIYNRRELLRRPLGGIEYMYNMYASQGTDTICLMTKIEAIYPVTSSHVIRALQLLQQRHPLLRMSIKPSKHLDDGRLDFVENEVSVCDFEVSERKDWLQYMLEELENPFNGESRSLIRYRMLNACTIPQTNNNEHKQKTASLDGPKTNKDAVSDDNDFHYQVTFLFIMHHSIMDGGYSLWMFQEFVNFLDAVVMNNATQRVKPLPLLPPMEHFFTLKNDQAVPSSVGSKHTSSITSLTFCHDSTHDTLLKAYNKKFHHEVLISPDEKIKNGCLVFQFDKPVTRTLVQAIKSKNCSPKGVITAASVFALLDLVYQDRIEEVCRNITIPLEFMMDSRRFCDFQLPGEHVPHYPGVAALHLPLVAQLQLTGDKLTADTFWKIATMFGVCLEEDVDSPEVYQWIQEEAQKYCAFPNRKEEPGKSPYVLNISNMGKLDGVLNADVTERIRLVALHGHSSILIDQMPLFFVTTFALNGHFCGNVSFCRNYTSNETAAKYVGLVQKYLCSYSKL